jgi:subtilisin-like proprotein convertase family protein
VTNRRRQVAAIAAAVLAVALLGAASAGAKSKTLSKSFSSGNLALAIPDDAGYMASPIDVKKKGKLKDVNVAVRLAHPYDADVHLLLRSPLGRYVELARDNGADGDDYGAGATDCSGTSTVFDDQASASINAATPPFAGPLQPEVPLSTLNGKGTRGRWELVLDDDSSPDSGTLHCWQLQLTYKTKKH